MVGWHHWLNGYEFEQAPGVGDRQGSLVYCSPWGRKESHSLKKKKKLGIKLPYDPAIPLLVICPEKITILKYAWTTMFVAPLFAIARTWKQPRCPLTYEWIKKL